MTKFDWDRMGPPRPGSGNTDHPKRLETPFVHKTEEQEARERRDTADMNRARGLVIHAAEWKARYGRPYPLTPEDRDLIKKCWGDDYGD